VTDTPDPTKEIVINNNSGAVAVVLMPMIGSKPDAGATQVYGQSLEMLASITGTPTIPKNGNATFLLDQYYTDPDTKTQKYSTIYNLLVSSASWYVPVANLGVMQNIFATPPNFPPQTITSDDAAALQNAAVFFQTISAYPTSALAKGYQSAMSGTLDNAAAAADGSANSSSNAANAISGGADAFFKSTKTFQNVTLAGLVAMENFYNNFPFVWAEYKTTTYYLYSSDGKTTSFSGTMTLTEPASLDITKANGGYGCSFAPAVNPTDTTSVDVDTSRAKTLTYANGLFVDDVDSDIPQIAVKGTFQIKRFFTQVSTDTNILTVLTGSINGATVIGFDAPQKSNDPGGSAYWDAIFHPKNSAQIFQAIMTIGGAVMMLFFFGQIAYGLYSKLRGLTNTKEPTTADMFKTQREALEDMFDAKIDELTKRMSNGRDQAPEDPDAALDDIDASVLEVGDNIDAALLKMGLESEASSLEEMAKFSENMTQEELVKLEQLGGDLQQANAALDGATPETISSVVAEQTTAFSALRADVKTFTEQLSEKLDDAAKAEIQQNSELSEAINDAIEDTAENNAENAADENPAGEDPVIPEI
jgi:hypothetical protein